MNVETADETSYFHLNLIHFVDDFGCYYYSQNEREGMVTSWRKPLPTMNIGKMVVVGVDLEADDWQSMWKWWRMQPVKVGFDNSYLVVVVDNDAVDDDKEDLGWMGFGLHGTNLFSE